MINVILQFLWLDHFNIKLSATFYENIPNGLIVNFTFFRIWTSAKPRPIQNAIWKSHGLHLVNIPMCMQNFITIFHTVQEIGPFSLFRMWSSAKSRPMKNDISQSLGLDLDNINVYAEVYQNIPLSSRDMAIFTDRCHFAIVSLFSEFEPRQKINQSKMSFDNLMGYILKISMCMQNFITIFHSVQEIAPLSLFQNLELGKASTNEKCQFAISWARYCQYPCLRKSLSK